MTTTYAEFQPGPLTHPRNRDYTLKISPQTRYKIEKSPLFQSAKKIAEFSPIAIITARMSRSTYTHLSEITKGLTNLETQRVHNLLLELATSGKVERRRLKKLVQYRLV